MQNCRIGGWSSQTESELEFSNFALPRDSTVYWAPENGSHVIWWNFIQLVTLLFCWSCINMFCKPFQGHYCCVQCVLISLLLLLSDTAESGTHNAWREADDVCPRDVEEWNGAFDFFSVDKQGKVKKRTLHNKADKAALCTMRIIEKRW